MRAIAWVLVIYYAPVSPLNNTLWFIDISFNTSILYIIVHVYMTVCRYIHIYSHMYNYVVLQFTLSEYQVFYMRAVARHR